MLTTRKPTLSLVLVDLVICLLLLLFPSSCAFLLPQSKAMRGLHRIVASSNTAPIEYDDLLPCPNPDIGALDVVHLCMDCLMNKSNNEGLEVCFKFSSDFLQAPFGGQLEKFVAHANNPVFASLVQCTKFEIVSTGPEIAGTNTRGTMQTFLMQVQSPNSEDRQFLWTLQKERRPPRQNCWLVHEVLFTDNALQLTM